MLTRSGAWSWSTEKLCSTAERSAETPRAPGPAEFRRRRDFQLHLRVHQVEELREISSSERVELPPHDLDTHPFGQLVRGVRVVSFEPISKRACKDADVWWLHEQLRQKQAQRGPHPAR